MEKKIDRRKNYYLVLDTETCNGFMEEGKLNLTDSLVYDIGFQIVDKKGNIYYAESFAITEIFEGEKDMMCSAYYANKIPSYYEEIEKGERKTASIWAVRRLIASLIETYNVRAVVAHNAPFDYRSLNNTVRWLSGSACRYFLPYGVELWDTMKMCADTIGQEKGYRAFCEKNGYLTKHKNPRCRLTAEILFRYISGDNDFTEVHKGLDDVKIESQLLVCALRKHKKMRKGAWEK